MENLENRYRKPSKKKTPKRENLIEKHNYFPNKFPAKCKEAKSRRKKELKECLK